MYGWIYCVYLKIKLWNRDRLKKRRNAQKKIEIENFFEKYSVKSLIHFESNFDIKHLGFMHKLDYFQSWQMNRLKTHTLATREICNNTIQNTNLQMENIIQQNKNILSDINQFKFEYTNLYNSKLKNNLQNVTLINTSTLISNFYLNYNHIYQNTINNLDETNKSLHILDSFMKNEDKQISRLYGFVQNLSLQSSLKNNTTCKKIFNKPENLQKKSILI